MKKLGMICVAMIIAMGAIGVAYASWSQSLTISSTVGVATSPALTTNAANPVGQTTATLNGTLNQLGTANSVAIYFKYGTSTIPADGTPNWTAATTSPLTSPGTFSLPISGLTAGTTYHYRVKAVGFGNWTIYGVDRYFVANMVATNAASGLGHSGNDYHATINGTLNGLGQSTSVNVFFEYGPTNTYGTTIAGTPSLRTTTGTFTAYLSGMVNKSVVHFRAKVVGNDGTTAYGLDQSFTN